MPVYRLPEHLHVFPSPLLTEPPGVLAVGGDLSVDRLVLAYAHGIFPWYGDDEPIMWWFPDPRCVLLPERIKISRSLRQTLRR
ncbi:MAG: leucyl/phenylalanyl-tRNA--protein transferase, partial [Saprospiraceae bacterium]|nr:leucyl/phenylalanyl-tRNA--protein transferase [Saprospiraceae bacterium]